MHIEFQNVTRTYHTRGGVITAVSELSWTAEAGTVYGILGPNGSGKTTLIRMLLNLIFPDRGEILIDGVTDGNKSKKFKDSLGYLPEERGLYKDETPLSGLLYLARLKNIPAREAREKIHRLMAEVELQDFINTPLKSFSKGMTQKVQLIAATQHDPELIVLDEPFAGLDPINRKLVRQFIKRRKSEGALILLCTHMMDEAERLADSVLMLNKGSIIQSGSQHQLRKDFGRERISIATEFDLNQLETIEVCTTDGLIKLVELKHSANPHDFLKEITDKYITFSELKILPARLEDIYIESLS